MKKSLADTICNLWNDNFAGSYAPTKTKAEVCVVKDDYSVEVHPCGEENNGHSFHSHNEVSDIERAFKVSAYITQDDEHKLYARIF